MSLPLELHGLRAARWIRESTAGQVDRYGPAAQREQQDRAIARLDLVDVGLAWQVAHSGATVDRTPAWAEMLSAAGSAYQVLLVGYASRFARNVEVVARTIRQLHEAGASVYFCDEQLWSADDTHWDWWMREAVEAESYRRRLARRVREGYAAKFRSGDQAGNPGLGFRRSPAPESRLVIDVATMPQAVELFTAYASGTVSLMDLEASTGIRQQAIRAILANPLYNGWAVRHRESATEERTPAPWRSDPPVSDELWARVQAVRHERWTGGGGPARRIHLLSKRLWCSCGRRIRADTTPQRRGIPLRRYRHVDPCPAWPQQTYIAGTFEDVIGAQLSSLRLDAAWLASMRALAGRRIPAPDRSELRRHQLERELGIGATALARRELSEAAFLALHARIAGELEALSARPAQTDPLVDPDVAIAALRDLRSTWRRSSDAARQAVVRALFERVVVEGDRVVREELTPWARQHGLALALPATVVLAPPEGTGAHRTTAHRILIVGRAEELAAVRAVRSA